MPLVLLAFVSGCGDASGEDAPQRAAVSGTVTFNGQPLPEGLVRFVPIDGTPGPKTAVPVSQGRFQVEAEHGPVVGTHRIEIQSTDDGGYAMDDEDAIRRLRESGVKRIEAIRIPPAYNTRSTLKETVTAEGNNEFQFDLNSARRR
ncbi:hypothetical protein [Maioricimonas rarisocia]|nr:hypothetical protein [Maioricimonas rarisocia]